MALSKLKRRQRIRKRIRKIVSGTAERPRLSIFRSNNEIYAQLIDDSTGTTLASVTSFNGENTGSKMEIAAAVGKAMAEKAADKGISTVVFDRGGYLYHGRVKSFADAAREAGLKF